MDFAQARHRLVPLLRGAAHPSQALRAAAIDPDKALVRQRFAPFLHVLLAVDLDDRLKFVSVGDLKQWDVHPDLAFQLARDNLDAASGLTRRGDGLWQLAAGDGYEASRLTLPGWLDVWPSTIGDQVVAGVPHSRALYVAGVQQADQLLALVREEWATAGSPISPSLYTLDDDGRVVPWMPDPDHRLRVPLENAHHDLAKAEYRAQRHALDELARGRVVARYGLMQHTDSGRMVSTCAWTQGAPALLPVTDLIALHGRDGESLLVPVQALLAVLPDALDTWPGLDPPRLSTQAFPLPAEWRALRKHALGRLA